MAKVRAPVRLPLRLPAPRALPPLALAAALRGLPEHWASRLSRYEQRRLTQLARTAILHPRSMSPGNRHELRRLSAQLDLATLLRHVGGRGTRPTESSGRRGR